MTIKIPTYALTAAVAFALGHYAHLPVASAAAPTTDELLNQIRALQGKLTALERKTAPRTSPTSSASGGGANALAALEEKLDRIGQVLIVTPSSVTLRSPGSLAIEAGAALSLKGGAAAKLESAGNLDLKGAVLKLNNGGKPVAYQGGKTVGTQSTQTITVGSPTVLVP